MKMHKLLYKSLLKKLSFCTILLALTYNTYAIERNVVHHSTNEFGPLWIYDQSFNQAKERCLSFIEPGSMLVQSCMIINKPNAVVFDYTSLMISSVFFHDNPRKILMIGLGGGTIPKAINVILPNATLDIVEINPSLPELAKEFFAFTPNQNTNIYIEDGVDFVKKAAAETYDIILLDAFTKDYIPPLMITKEFALGIKKMLKQNGVLSVNTLTNNVLHDQETKLFTEAFGKIYNVVAGGNRIIYAKNGMLPELQEIGQNSVFWRFRLAEVWIDQVRMMGFLNNFKEYHN
jgi:spermidine synthase